MQQRKISLLPQPSSLEDLVSKARAFVQSAKAPATLKAYRSDWNDFDSWCRRHQPSPALRMRGSWGRASPVCKKCAEKMEIYHRSSAPISHALSRSIILPPHRAKPLRLKHLPFPFQDRCSAALEASRRF